MSREDLGRELGSGEEYQRLGILYAAKEVGGGEKSKWEYVNDGDAKLACLKYQGSLL